MNRRTLILACCVPLLLLASGCHCFERVYQPLACDAGWDPVLGACDVCGVCGGDCVGHTPCQHTKHLLTCASGCGDIYWGEWISDPPDKCDPCDNCGNYVGPQPCAPGFCDILAAGWHHFWGYRQAGACCGLEGGVYDGEVYDGEWELMKGESAMVDPGDEAVPYDYAAPEDLAPPPPINVPQTRYQRRVRPSQPLNFTALPSQRFAR